MQFNPDTMSVAEVYRLMVQLITPRPIAWISTVSQEGVANLAPYSFYNGVGANPPSLLFCPANQRDGSRKDSLVNVLQTKEFVVNVVSESDAALMNQTSAQYAPGVSESEVLGIETQPAETVDPPRVVSSLAQFECRLLQHIELATGPGGGNVVIGEIVMMHVADSILQGQNVDTGKLNNLGRLGGKSYAKTSERFELDRPTAP